MSSEREQAIAVTRQINWECLGLDDEWNDVGMAKTENFIAAALISAHQRGFDEAKELAMTAQCEGCRDKWPARKIAGDREYWWHEMENISRECTAAAIRALGQKPTKSS